MLPGTLTASFLSACLTIFFAVNMYGLLRKAGANRKNVEYEAEVELPHNLALALCALGTGLFFFLSVSYIVLVIVGLDTVVGSSFLQLMFPLNSWVQLVGMAVTTIGYALFLWSVLARGKYATSWE
ncbi:MAG: hypothetical protein WCC63_04260, partial [Candidatus Bathyarchaeia archaeon]